MEAQAEVAAEDSLFTPSLGGRAMKPATCGHGRVRALVPCAECWADFMKQAYVCTRVASRAKSIGVPCEHFKEMRRCKICCGSWICQHGKNKVYCKECDGRRLCQVCFEKSMPRCWEVCMRCRQGLSTAAEAPRRRWKPII